MKNSDCFTLSVFILSASGMWIPNNFKRYPRRLFYCCFAILLQGIMYFAIVLSEIAYLFSVLGDTKKSLDAMVLMLSHLVQGVKMMTIWGKQQKIQDLIVYIDGPTFTRSEGNTNKIIQMTIKYGKLVDKCIFGSVSVTVLFWITVPFLQSHMSLPLHTSYPFEFDMAPRFQLMFLYNSMSVFLVGIVDGAMNYLVSGLMTLAGAQLDVLVYELEHIPVDKKNVNGKKVAHKIVLHCLKYHQAIIRYVDELGNIFGTTIFCQFLTSSIVICLTVFKITISTKPIELITMVFYLICIFMELIMYCYPGDLVLNKSIAVAKAAYSCDWVSLDVRTQRLLLIMAARGQRALVTKAGGVYPVSLPTAAAVVQTAYSYYAMLKNTQSH